MDDLNPLGCLGTQIMTEHEDPSHPEEIASRKSNDREDAQFDHAVDQRGAGGLGTGGAI